MSAYLYKATPTVYGDGVRAEPLCDLTGSPLAAAGIASSINISAAKVVKATPGRLVRINVTTAGSTAGTAADVATTGGVAAGNTFYSIPNTVGTYFLDWPCAVGIVITPGTSQVISVSYT